MAIEVLYIRNLLEKMGYMRAPVFEDSAACIDWRNHVIGGREGAC